MDTAPSGPQVGSDHWDGRRFFNPDGPAGRTLTEVLRWKTAGTRKPWSQQTSDGPPKSLPPAPAAPDIAVTFVNHSTFLLRSARIAILSDPIWSERASPVSWAGPRRIRPPGIPIDALPDVQFVLLSHNHYDHMDLPTLRRLQKRCQPHIITGLGNGHFLRRQGLGQVTELDWWQSQRPVAELEVTLTPARHFSGRGLFDRDRTLWGGFFLTLTGQHVFFAGDTGYGQHFRQVRTGLGPPDLALLPIGAYEPRWFMQAAHMNPAEAVHAHRDLNARRSLGMHFGTFQLTDEGIDEPLTALTAACAAEHLGPDEFGVLGLGETRVVHPS